MTHLWWLSDRTPEIDPYSPDQSKLDANRARCSRSQTSSCRATASRSGRAVALRRGDVQPDVVDLGRQPGGDLVDEGVLRGQPGEVCAEDHGPQERLERLARREAGRLRLEPRLAVLPARLGQPAARVVRLAKNTSPVQPSPIVASTARTEAVLPTPPYCATSRRRAGSRQRDDGTGRVVADPVEGRGREDRVDGFIDRERAPQVRLELDPIAEPGEPSAGLVEHRRGPSSATTRPRGSRASRSSVTRPLPQPASRTRSSPSSRSRRRSTTTAPAGLGIGHGVVRGAIPVPRLRAHRPSIVPAAIEEAAPGGHGLVVQGEIRRSARSA